MFGYRSKYTAFMLALIAFASTGCGGSGAGSPMGVSAPVMATRIGTMATALNVSGHYAGTVKDLRDLAAQIPLCIKTLLAGYTFHVCAD
jgi:hypothetical protein